jgi:hypothetical protein
MPSGTVMPYPRLQFFDSNGDPLSSGSLLTYEAGSTTPLATYSDSGLLTALPTTITLNAAGRPQTSLGVETAVYLAPRAYKFVLKNSAGVTVYTQDNIYALQPAASVNLEIDGIAGEDLAANDPCYLSDGSAGKNAGRWYKTDADLGFYAGIGAVVGFATAAITTGNSVTIRRGGTMDGFVGLVAGTRYYLSTTAGQITATAPTNARSVGVASSATALAIDFSPAWIDRLSNLNIVEGRLTLTTGTPVTTGDVSAAVTLYFTPYKGNRVALYDGTSQWKLYPFAELSITLVGTTASKPYDVFLYDNAGVLTLELLVWTNATTRATALVLQNGVLVKTGATSRRYLGTVYINASGGQTDDTLAKRYVWNYYNRTRRAMRVTEPANSWNYTTATLRQMNANTANQLDFMQGVDEDAVAADVRMSGSNTNAATALYIGMGLDVTNANVSGLINHRMIAQVANQEVCGMASWIGHPGVGRHFLAALEYSEAVGTSTWVGDNGAPSLQQNGIFGHIMG